MRISHWLVQKIMCYSSFRSITWMTLLKVSIFIEMTYVLIKNFYQSKKSKFKSTLIILESLIPIKSYSTLLLSFRRHTASRISNQRFSHNAWCIMWAIIHVRFKVVLVQHLPHGICLRVVTLIFSDVLMRSFTSSFMEVNLLHFGLSALSSSTHQDKYDKQK